MEADSVEFVAAEATGEVPNASEDTDLADVVEQAGASHERIDGAEPHGVRAGGGESDDCFGMTREPGGLEIGEAGKGQRRVVDLSAADPGVR